MENENLTRREETDLSTRLTYLLIGGGIGAVLALLFAPKSGQELRGDIADVTRKGIDRTRDAASYVGGKAGEYYETTRDRAGDLVDSVRGAATRRTGQFSAAVEAGKQAYAEEKRRTELSTATEAKPTYPPQGDMKV
ncbi:MAG TPA: YtxH domain-containing protein [Pyrinomonadaceae bacterium]